MDVSDLEYKVLKILEHNPRLTQRDVAKALGLSLGKTHYLIRALIDKGWVKFNNFRCSTNKIGYSYLLTPKGMVEKTRLAWKFLARKQEEYNQLKIEIEVLQGELKK